MSNYPGTMISMATVMLTAEGANAELAAAVADVRAQNRGGAFTAGLMLQLGYVQDDGSLLIVIMAPGVEARTLRYPADGWRERSLD
ncbi:hypothetical protein [Pseudoxanthomonas winnipegensis]|uniref:Uncharacterized protein n=1 Tax=Pseudoxanthomonas winnipegensis TaxID=2480810 RepID=A0A4V2HFE4_9GAMM|nr:hypothetical protein [Pseudoxanthomonas winnipegensis]RZZ90583.1 hypothetical protein EA663_02175 [Pseudoxanthomonas winnipegensis]TAA37261.1 hypothetical protein EA656_00865 [Pseudoxanthomonas winnipegensis]